MAEMTLDACPFCGGLVLVCERSVTIYGDACTKAVCSLCGMEFRYKQYFNPKSSDRKLEEAERGFEKAFNRRVRNG